MYDSFWDPVIYGVLAFCSLCIVIMILIAFSYLPFYASGKKHCLEQGYPKATITYDYDLYCMNLDGSVTVKVDKQ